MRGIGHRHVGEVAQHHLHQHVLEPDPGAAQRGGLVAAVRDPFGLAHRVPRRGAVEREQLGREVERGVVDRHRPVDLAEGVEGGALGGGDQLAGAGGGAGQSRAGGGRSWSCDHRNTCSSNCQDILTVITVNVTCRVLDCPGGRRCARRRARGRRADVRPRTSSRTAAACRSGRSAGTSRRGCSRSRPSRAATRSTAPSTSSGSALIAELRDRGLTLVAIRDLVARERPARDRRRVARHRRDAHRAVVRRPAARGRPRRARRADRATAAPGCSPSCRTPAT